jgi:hypothetical protein
MLHSLLQKNKIKLHTMTKKRINVESSVFFIISKITIISIYYWSGVDFF